jgi:hypothetical protein
MNYYSEIIIGLLIFMVLLWFYQLDTDTHDNVLNGFNNLEYYNPQIVNPAALDII